jgi:hypothetical protein
MGGEGRGALSLHGCFLRSPGFHPVPPRYIYTMNGKRLHRDDCGIRTPGNQVGRYDTRLMAADATTAVQIWSARNTRCTRYALGLVVYLSTSASTVNSIRWEVSRLQRGTWFL